MSEFNRIFSVLKLKFAPNIDWDYVEDCLTEYESEDEARQCAYKFWSLPMCRQNLQDQDHQLQMLRELSNCIRSIRCGDNDNQSSYDATYDNWAKIEDISPREYLAYIYALASLATLSQDTLNGAMEPLNENINIQLALNAVSTYFLTLTIPGAKSYGIFDEGVIEHCLKVFKLLELNANSGIRANNIWILFVSICDDLKLVFRYVHFKDHQKPRDDIIKCLLQIIYNNFRKGYNNSSGGVLIVGLSYAAVPLYSIFCQAYSYGGTTSQGHDAEKVEHMQKVADRVMKIRFNADIGSSMRWNFKPQQYEIKVAPGETALAFYTAKNPTDKPVIGISTYNVIPFEAGAYFNKIQCFCFEEQMLNPHEEVDMPVFFYIDPEITQDPALEYCDTITLSYTFFEAKEGLQLNFPSYVKPHAAKQA
ncbi:hypothetical protein ACLKA7_003995 [Drosophila subpalustris]